MHSLSRRMVPPSSAHRLAHRCDSAGSGSPTPQVPTGQTTWQLCSRLPTSRCGMCRCVSVYRWCRTRQRWRCLTTCRMPRSQPSSRTRTPLRTRIRRCRRTPSRHRPTTPHRRPGQWPGHPLARCKPTHGASGYAWSARHRSGGWPKCSAAVLRVSIPAPPSGCVNRSLCEWARQMFLASMCATSVTIVPGRGAPDCSLTTIS
jgi:hypothetical protein